MKELKKSIQRLERLQTDVIAQLKNLDKTDGHDQRLARVEKLGELEMIESQLADRKSTCRQTPTAFPGKTISSQARCYQGSTWLGSRAHRRTWPHVPLSAGR